MRFILSSTLVQYGSFAVEARLTYMSGGKYKSLIVASYNPGFSIILEQNVKSENMNKKKHSVKDTSSKINRLTKSHMSRGKYTWLIVASCSPGFSIILEYNVKSGNMNNKRFS